MNGNKTTRATAEQQAEMARLLKEIATERTTAERLDEKGAARFAAFHWSVVKRDRTKLAKLIDDARQEAQA